MVCYSITSCSRPFPVSSRGAGVCVRRGAGMAGEAEGVWGEAGAPAGKAGAAP